jgi:hypothetical protein
VLAIIITVKVLELKVPHGQSSEALAPLIAVFLSYVLSFVYVGIYWNNHHHRLHTCHKVTGPMLWANLHLLLWLSLLPLRRHFGRNGSPKVCTYCLPWFGLCQIDASRKLLPAKKPNQRFQGTVNFSPQISQMTQIKDGEVKR